MEDCELYYITKEEYDYLRSAFHEFAFIASELFPKYVKEFWGYTDMIRKHTTDETYELFLEQKGELLQYVPGKLLGPWLGMSEETLSRRRNDGRKK
jgi:CRP-like cAMP-binding protein